MQAHLGERILLKKRLDELEENYRTLKKIKSIVSLKEFKEIKTAIPLLKITLASTNKNLDNVRTAMSKYGRFIAC